MNIEAIELATAIAVISWTISQFEPIQNIIKLLPNKFIILPIIKKILSCPKCTAFHISWIYLLTQHPHLLNQHPPLTAEPLTALTYACLSALIAHLIDKHTAVTHF
jgi:hypothetical protein